MGKAKNIVISGLYSDKKFVIKSFIRTRDKQFKRLKYLAIQTDFTNFVIINEQNIKSIEIINQEGVQTDIGSSVARSIAGSLLLGSAGLIAGAGMGKQNSINMLQINWKNEQKSLIEVDYTILSMLNTICWNIQNGIEGDKLTNEVIQEQKKQGNMQTKGCFITCIKIFLAFMIVLLSAFYPHIWLFVAIWIIYKLINKKNKEEK